MCLPYWDMTRTMTGVTGRGSSRRPTMSSKLLLWKSRKRAEGNYDNSQPEQRFRGRQTERVGTWIRSVNNVCNLFLHNNGLSPSRINDSVTSNLHSTSIYSSVYALFSDKNFLWDFNDRLIYLLVVNLTTLSVTPTTYVYKRRITNGTMPYEYTVTAFL
jgi:hypothetical protein